MEIRTRTGSIQSQVIPYSGISLFEVQGRLHGEAFIEAIVKHWAHTPTPHAMWDFEFADLSDLDPDACHEIVAVANDLVKLRGNHPISVLITKNMPEIWLLRFYMELMEIGRSAISFKIVDTKELAIQYLLEHGTL